MPNNKKSIIMLHKIIILLRNRCMLLSLKSESFPSMSSASIPHNSETKETTNKTKKTIEIKKR